MANDAERVEVSFTNLDEARHLRSPVERKHGNNISLAELLMLAGNGAPASDGSGPSASRARTTSPICSPRCIWKQN